MNFSRLATIAKVPVRKHNTDSGLDLFSSEYVVIEGCSSKIVHTGVTIEIPEECAGFIWPKSRSDFLIGGGVVDFGYSGECLVKVVNYKKDPLVINIGDAIAQLVLTPVRIPSELVELPLTEIHQKHSERGHTGGIVTQASKLELIDREDFLRYVSSGIQNKTKVNVVDKDPDAVLNQIMLDMFNEADESTLESVD